MGPKSYSLTQLARRRLTPSPVSLELMDNLRDQLSNVSLYDVKAYVRKAQNAVLNFSDIEAKVREATNNEPWGASTTVMQQIADATQGYQQFHEVMPFVYRRFTEKSASSWRQIFKALQLLDYLIKNGSERVVDYARSHTAVIDMLRHFHYIDRYGVDQGQGIRKRAEDLIALLGSTDRIRAERKKSRALNMKTGVGSLSSVGGGFGGSGKKYGGFGSEQLRATKFGGGAADGIYGGGAMDARDFNRASYSTRGGSDDEFEEYDAGPTVGSSRSSRGGVTSRTAAKEDIISFDNDKGAEKEDDDEFADFQSAPATSTNSAPANTKDSILDLFSAPMPPAGAGPSSTSMQPQSPSPSTNLFGFDNFASAEPAQKPQPAPPQKKTDLFESLWESSKTSAPASASAPAPGLSNQAPKQNPGASSLHQTFPPSQPQQNAPNPPAPAPGDDLLML